MRRRNKRMQQLDLVNPASVLLWWKQQQWIWLRRQQWFLLWYHSPITFDPVLLRRRQRGKLLLMGIDPTSHAGRLWAPCFAEQKKSQSFHWLWNHPCVISSFDPSLVPLSAVSYAAFPRALFFCACKSHLSYRRCRHPESNVSSWSSPNCTLFIICR